VGCLYFTFRSNLSKNLNFGVLHPCRCTGGGEIWHGGGDLLLHAKFHPNRCNVSPLPGEKPQNRPLSKFNTGRFPLRAMLPVKKLKPGVVASYDIRPENGEGLLLFQSFINLDTKPTYSYSPGTHTGFTATE